TLSWGSATAVTVGSCTVPLAGSAIDGSRSCTVLGLAAATGYQFELVAFRGTLNVNAVFGNLSNIASGTTTGTVASLTVTPSTVSHSAGAAQQLTATLKDASGNVLTGRTVVWTSNAPTVATVSGNGLETGMSAG